MYDGRKARVVFVWLCVHCVGIHTSLKAAAAHVIVVAATIGFRKVLLPLRCGCSFLIIVLVLLAKATWPLQKVETPFLCNEYINGSYIPIFPNL